MTSKPKESSTSKKRAAKAPPAPPPAGIGKGEVVKLPIAELDLADTTFMFRAVVRVADLKKSLQQEGQQIPIIVRRTQGKKLYQIISGFRRTQAATQLGWSEIAAIVRTGLTDEEAFRAAVLENMARKNYSDIDRAYIIKAYQDRKYKGADIAKVMNLTDRQVRNLRSLLELPVHVQDAVGDPEQYFVTTHALTLKKLAAVYDELDWYQWIETVNQEKLSVAKLRRLVNKEHAGQAERGFESLFQANGTNWKTKQVRFAPVKLDLVKMSDGEKKKLRGELQRVLETLG